MSLIPGNSGQPAIAPSGITGTAGAALSLPGGFSGVSQITSVLADADKVLASTDNLRMAMTASVARNIVLPSSGVAQGAQVTVINTGTAAAINVRVTSVGGTIVKSISVGSYTTFVALIATPTASTDWSMVEGNTPIVASATDGLMPFSLSSLDNATATRMGLKVYLGGTNYNGGISPTLQGTPPGYSAQRIALIPYQVQDGSWRMKFNIAYTMTSSTVADFTGIIGVTLISTQQTCSPSTQTGASISPLVASIGSASGFVFRFNTAVTGVLMSGDIEIASKPTWAY